MCKLLVVKGSNFAHGRWEIFAHFSKSNFVCWVYVNYQLPVSALNTIVHNEVVTCQKKLWRNLALANLKLSPIPKFFCINVFSVGGCLASCLTFRTFLTLDP